MTTTIILLLVLIEAARLALQWWSYKKYGEEREKTYCTTYKVYNVKLKVPEEEVNDYLDDFGKQGYEIAAAIYNGFNKTDGKHYYTLLLTKKEIKNFKED